MNRFDSTAATDPFRALTPMRSLKEKRVSKNSNAYSEDFQAMLDRLDDEDCLEENTIAGGERKRRLKLHQVQALEKNFEIENRLDPERKAKLAEELCLEPRQVAVWFQNRRARWKTKQLERDYALLKCNYDALRLNFNVLERQKEALGEQIRELKGKFPGEKAEEGAFSVKMPSPLFSQTEHMNSSDQSKVSESESTPLSPDLGDGRNLLGFRKFEEGPTDSDSSGVVKEESNDLSAQIMISPAASSSSFGFNSSSSQFVSPHAPMDWFQMSDCRDIPERGFQQQFVRMEGQDLYSCATEESCNFFSVDQAPTLHWYYPNQ